MNTIVGRHQSNTAISAYIFILPVIFYWLVWAVCILLIEDNLEGAILMRSIIPNKILGLPIHLLVFLFTATSLFFSVYAKLRKRTRWYKTPNHIRVAISLGMFLMFLVFLQLLM